MAPFARVTRRATCDPSSHARDNSSTSLDGGRGFRRRRRGQAARDAESFAASGIAPSYRRRAVWIDLAEGPFQGASRIQGGSIRSGSATRAQTHLPCLARLVTCAVRVCAREWPDVRNEINHQFEIEKEKR
jgi:hypothetical protein